MAAAMPLTDFKFCIEKIFDSWSVLQLAVQQGFGGYLTMEKAKWLVDATEQWFKDNRNLDPYEVEDFLSEILNNEFDTIADDGSLSHVAGSLCKCYSLIQQGKTSDVDVFLSKLLKPKLGECVREDGQASDEDSEEGEEAEEESGHTENNAMDVNEPEEVKQDAASNTEQDNSMDADSDAPVDDGWTVIHKGKKKR